MTDITVDRNTSTGRGGGIESKGGPLTVTRSTISNNSAVFNGGGIFHEFAISSVELVNSTISGAIQNCGATLLGKNSTITKNTATQDGIGGGV